MMLLQATFNLDQKAKYLGHGGQAKYWAVLDNYKCQDFNKHFQMVMNEPSSITIVLTTNCLGMFPADLLRYSSLTYTFRFLIL